MTDPAGGTAAGTRRAWGWVAHLRAGGTTGWEDWAGDAEPSGPRLPGAQQLVLLRRVNTVGRPGPRLVEQLLAVEPPRRSRPAMPLAGAGATPEHGPQPVDPASVTDNELTRLVAVVLTGQLAAYPLGPEPGRRHVRRVRHRLVGDPEYTVPLRRALTGGPRAADASVDRVLVIGTDTGRMLVDLWTAHCFRNGAVPWGQWIDRRAVRGDLPDPIDLDRIARQEAAEVGSSLVRVVVDPAELPRLLRIRRPPELPAPPAAACAVDLGRRIAALLRPCATWPHRSRLINEVLRPVLASAPGLPLVVPARHREWVAAGAERMHHQVARGRYRVHGDPARLVPVERAGVEQPDTAEALALGIRLLLAGTLGAASTKEAP